MDTQPSAPVRSYFVDEAGDGTLFDKRGRVIVGKEGCSRFFMLGLADIGNPAAVGAELAQLRAQLLADPYFKGVPSMQPEERFVQLLWPAVRLVHDVDDTREAGYGAYYTKRKPLTAAALGGVPGIYGRPTAAERSHGMEPNFVPGQP